MGREKGWGTAGDSARLVMFAQGFAAMLPLWAGAIPIGIAYGVAARGAGLSFGEAQLMSLVVFSAAAQVSALSLLEAGAPGVVLIGTAMALNAQVLLIGLTVGRQVSLSRGGRLVTAYFLTDGTYGVALAVGRLRLPVLLGAGVSMFVAWNVGSGIGSAAGDVLPDLHGAGVDFVAPLTFMAVLIPLVRTRAAVVAALVAAAATPLLAWLAPGGVMVLGAGLIGSAAGAWWAHHDGGSSNGAAASLDGSDR